MISTNSKTSFKYINRGKKNLIVLIPGWASDYRIFAPLDLNFNYLVPVDLFPFSFIEDLFNFLKKREIASPAPCKGGVKTSLLGWSLGGFLACEFALKCADLVDQLILVSIRKKYNQKELGEIRNFLQKNKKGYLYKFYRQCFCQKKQFAWFKKYLLKSYLKIFDLDYLLKGLDYLENATFDLEKLKTIKKIKIIHGECDQIAPPQEAREIKDNLDQAEISCLKGAGHFPFLEKDFAKYLW